MKLIGSARSTHYFAADCFISDPNLICLSNSGCSLGGLSVKTGKRTDYSPNKTLERQWSIKLVHLSGCSVVFTSAANFERLLPRVFNRTDSDCNEIQIQFFQPEEVNTPQNTFFFLPPLCTSSHFLSFHLKLLPSLYPFSTSLMLLPLKIYDSATEIISFSFLFPGAPLSSVKVYTGSDEWEGYWERAVMEASLQIKTPATMERAVTEKISQGWGWGVGGGCCRGGLLD